ncbi:hypothetical protein BAU14_08180 [Enterococcus sp. CU9D]|nr:hypothetical protein BAU14_08180 [Enterococcus sp. CU9D]
MAFSVSSDFAEMFAKSLPDPKAKNQLAKNWILKSCTDKQWEKQGKRRNSYCFWQERQRHFFRYNTEGLTKICENLIFQISSVF